MSFHLNEAEAGWVSVSAEKAFMAHKYVCKYVYKKFIIKFVNKFINMFINQTSFASFHTRVWNFNSLSVTSGQCCVQVKAQSYGAAGSSTNIMTEEEFPLWSENNSQAETASVRRRHSFCSWSMKRSDSNTKLHSQTSFTLWVFNEAWPHFSTLWV